MSARAATVDSALTFVTTVAFLLLAMARREPSAPGHRWRCMALMYACIGLAVLAKGPVGMVLPLAAMGLLPAVDRRLAERVSLGMVDAALHGAARHGGRGPAVVRVGGHADRLEVARQFFLEFNLRPFQQPILGHGDMSSHWGGSPGGEPVSILYYFYHVPFMLVGFFPWAVFLGPTLVETVGASSPRRG